MCLQHYGEIILTVLFAPFMAWAFLFFVSVCLSPWVLIYTVVSNSLRTNHNQKRENDQ